MPVKWNTNRKENEEKQEAFMNKVFGVGWREQAEQRRKEQEAAQKEAASKAPKVGKFPRRA